MLSCFDFIREFNLLTVTLRLVLAMLCGGLIGIEREFKHRPAGFRTHILICLGAAMATLTSQYLFFVMKIPTDIARLGAQVIAGIGFIGAGSIIVTKRQRVKGLTTAAGLWTAAIIGLVCGAGYAECAIAATVLVLVAELLLIKIEYRFARRLKDTNLYVEYAQPSCIEAIIRVLRTQGVDMTGLEISRISGDSGKAPCWCALVTLQAGQGHRLKDDVIKALTAIDDVVNIEEL